MSDAVLELSGVEQTILHHFVSLVEHIESPTMHVISVKLTPVNVALVLGRELVDAKSMSQIVFELAFVLVSNLLARLEHLLAFELDLVY